MLGRRFVLIERECIGEDSQLLLGLFRGPWLVVPDSADGPIRSGCARNPHAEPLDQRAKALEVVVVAGEVGWLAPAPRA